MQALPLHIYYVFSSTLIASCGEAMTERCGGAAEFVYSVGSTTGDLSVLLISHLNGNSETRYAKLPKPLNAVSSLQLFLKGEVERIDGRTYRLNSALV
ncbi:hypothetical protein [Nostoc sp. 'Peltigera malacea cyanobiont' DB3992]|uniref:hypothetical protein n=1 Tax=Nostoc sp. 'Peltigera malacea cyanobiont' DB3992 TaxID=1206980 RepID=UPI000C04DF7D|nr:hypothetical protein [Nostoc sp. 'Peltigera malacea cyanobiont' DB3992]PHM06869.1 hypothetical protein CK516_30680 [Nostoc sp. 'Peltigera malacea cyanobiont' DB3992]